MDILLFTTPGERLKQPDFGGDGTGWGVARNRVLSHFRSGTSEMRGKS